MSDVQVDAPVEDSGSLTEFEAQYHPRRGQEPVAPTGPVQTELPVQEASDDAEETPEAKAERDRNKDGTFAKGKHRAQSQQARSEDAPRIQKLTAARKEAEERANVLEARIRELESTRASQDSAPVVRLEPEKVEYGEKEPTLDHFKDAEDPYAAWIRAVARYDLKKEQFEEKQKAQAEASEAENRQLASKAEELRATYNDRLEAAKEKYSDFDDLLVKHQTTVFTPVMQAMAILHEDGPDIVYHLLTHPHDLAGVRLLTSQQPATQDNVADAMVWLSERRTQVGQTGSTASAPRKYSPPPPPNPVRTVPSGHSSSNGDVEGMSLTDFEANFGKKRVRR